MSKKLLVLIAALLFHGCVSATIRSSAVSYNIAIEESENKTLLLNVVRSSERRPMYLSSISKVTGSVKAEGTLGAMLPFAQYGRAMGNAATGLFTGTPGSTFNINPTFDVSPLNTQEFMLGFMAPINKKTMAFLFNQGWAPELLLHLFVARVEIAAPEQPSTPSTTATSPAADPLAPATPPTILLNRPNGDHQAEMEAFKVWVNNFVNDKLQVVKVQSCENVGPVLTAAQLGKVTDLVAAIDDGLTVHQVKDGFQMVRISEDLQFASPTEKIPLLDLDKCKKEAAVEDAAGKLETTRMMTTKNAKSAKNATLLLRSPEAILYYLGELTRYEGKHSPPTTKFHGEGDELPLFVALEAKRAKDGKATKEGGCTAGDVTVDYNGKRFIIPAQGVPGCEPGRSMQALGLLSELIALQKSAKDLPTTSVVRAIAQ